jgi:serine/threonine protein kinase
VIISAYELLGTIGQGGMGIVYRARHRETGELVALKVMKPEAAANPLLRSRFAQEFAAASRLSHLNVVRMLACDVQRERPFLVMELVEGHSLGEHISQQGCLAEEEALRIIRQVANGLGCAHKHKLIHRDVKPDNILLTLEGQAKLTDLGLVKDVSTRGELTTAGTGLGTIAYVAPEQFEDASSATALSDVYGLGATLYHALTGVPPFRGRMQHVILKKKLTNNFVPPINLVASLRPCVSQAICRALDNLPERRPQSCEAFVAELQHTPRVVRAPGSLSREPGRERRETSEPKGADRRTARRFPSLVPVSCAPVWNRRALCRGMARDVSTTGTLMRLPRRFEPGAVLVVELLDEQDGVGQTVMVKVRWVKKVAEQEWEAGCSFDHEISEHELNVMLGNLVKTDVFTHRDGRPSSQGLL